jgi:hypothetical protein
MTLGNVRRTSAGHVLSTLDVPETALRAEIKLTRVDRRAFLSLAALTARHGSGAGEIYSSIAANDGGLLATVQTTHGTDLVIAFMVEPAIATRLKRWMVEGSDPVLRVNAAGILAKMPSQETLGTSHPYWPMTPRCETFTRRRSSRVCVLSTGSGRQTSSLDRPLGNGYVQGSGVRLIFTGE